VGPRDRPHLTPQRLRRRLPQPPTASQGGVYPSRRCVLSPDDGQYSAHTCHRMDLRPGPPATPSAAALAPQTSAASPRPTREVHLRCSAGVPHDGERWRTARMPPMVVKKVVKLQDRALVALSRRTGSARSTHRGHRETTRRLKWCANHRCVTPWGSGGGSRGMVLPVANVSLSSKVRADSWITRKRWRSSTSGWASNLSMWSGRWPAASSFRNVSARPVQTVVDRAADCLMCEPGSRHLAVVRGRRCVRDGKH
jgi:hypothetical protein